MKQLFFFIAIVVSFAACSSDDEKEPAGPEDFKEYGEYFYSLSNAVWPDDNNRKYLSIPCMIEETDMSPYEDELWIEWYPDGYTDDRPTLVITFEGETDIVEGLSGPLTNIKFNSKKYSGDDNVLTGYFKSTTDFYFENNQDEGANIIKAYPVSE